MTPFHRLMVEILKVIPDFLQLVDVKQHSLSLVLRQVLSEVHSGFSLRSSLTETAVKQQ